MKKNYYTAVLLVVLFISLSGRNAAIAAIKTFTGTGNFSDATKWNGGTRPNAGDDLIIDGTCTFDDTRGLTYGRLRLGNPVPAGVIVWPVGGTQRFIVDRIIMNNTASSINMTNGGILRIITDWNFGSGTFVAGTGTVEWYHTGSSAIPSLINTFNNLIINTPAAATTSLGANTTINGNLTVLSGILDTRLWLGTAVYNLTLRGNWIHAGTFVARTSTVTFSGSAIQLLLSTTAVSFNNLTMNNSLGLTINLGITINSVLTFTRGRITTGTQVVTIASTGSVVGGGAGRYVYGRLQKTFNAGSNVSQVFEVGNSTTYNPATITFPTVSTAGQITVYETAGDHPQIGSSCIDPTKSVNFYWTLLNTTVAPVLYDASFTFTPTDYDAIANPLLFGASAYSGAWTIPIASRTSTTVSATGNTAIGSFAFGESATPASVSVSSSVGSSVCKGTSVTLTATPVNGGASPVYQWKKNGLDVGLNSATYIDSTLSPSDSVRVVITSNAPCVFIPVVSSLNIVFTGIPGVWMGTTSSDWQTTSNWCSSTLPVATTNIIINSGVPFYPVLTAAASINNLTISAGATLSLNGFLFTVNGNILSTGSLIGSPASSLILNGTGSSTVYFDQSSRDNRSLLNLTVNKPSGGSATMSDSLLVYGTVTLSSGTFSTADKLRLMSTSSATARIGQITGGNISGKITMERFLPSGSGWRLLGAAVSGATLNSWKDDFVTGGFPGSHYPTSVQNPSILTYNESVAGIYDSGYVAPSGIGDGIGVNQGFWTYIINTPLTIDVTGNPVTGSQSVSLSYTNNDLPSEVGWNLIANPYPSTVDWDAAGWTKTNMDPAIYMFDPGSEQYSTYVGGIGINGGTQYIPSSHGFLVQAIAPGANLSFTEAVKSAADPAFMKMNSTQLNDLIKLKVTGAAGNDETVIRFHPDATAGYDVGLDANKLINWASWAPIIASVGANDYSINSLPLLDQAISIPLRVIAWTSGTYTISKESVSSLPSLSCVILEDLLTGTKINLATNSSYSVYLSDTAWAPRFMLHFSSPAKLTTLPDACDNGKAIIELPAGTYNVTWKDLPGSVLSNVTGIQIADTLDALNAGSYTVSLSTAGSYCSSVTDTFSIDQVNPYLQIIPSDASCSYSTDGSVLMSCYEHAGLQVSISRNGNNIFSGIIDTTSMFQNLAPGLIVISYNGECLTGSDSLNVGISLPVSAAFIVANDTLSQGASYTFADQSTGANNYFWDFGDGDTDSLQSPSHSYFSPGVYSVSLIAGNSACSDTSVQEIYVVPVNISEDNEALMKIFITESNLLNIFSPTEQRGDFVLKGFDPAGRQVMDQKMPILSAGMNSISLPSLAPGIYLFVVTGSERSFSSHHFIR